MAVSLPAVGTVVAPMPLVVLGDAAVVHPGGVHAARPDAQDPRTFDAALPPSVPTSSAALGRSGRSPAPPADTAWLRAGVSPPSPIGRAGRRRSSERDCTVSGAGAPLAAVRLVARQLYSDAPGRRT